ncbi:MAG: 30S ribosome-binding factor RbfA [Bacteroidales bacterium]|nr:30S ribosome-binding factor RbfA [Bacteroidales bacterium]
MSTRQNKVSKQVQKDMAEIIQHHSRKIAPGKMLTVTGVRISADLGIARINISVFPSAEADKIVGYLNMHVSEFRNELGQRLRHQLKKVPELKFYLDDSLDYIDNIDNLLNK